MPDTPLNPDALEAGAKAIDPGVYGTFEADLVKHAGFSKTAAREYADAKKRQLEGMARAAVSAYLAAALPEMTEREQVTALPDKIVLEDRRGTIWQKINGTWYTPGSKHDYSDQSVMLPARVLYRPEVKP